MANWVLEHNDIHDNNLSPNPAPPGSFQAGVPPGVGVLLLGVSDNVVAKNNVSNNDFVGHWVNDILPGNATVDRGSQSNFNLLTPVNHTFGDPLSRTTIFHCDHNVLSNVCKLTSQVTRVSCFQSGIRQTFSSTVR